MQKGLSIKLLLFCVVLFLELVSPNRSFLYGQIIKSRYMFFNTPCDLFQLLQAVDSASNVNKNYIIEMDEKRKIVISKEDAQLFYSADTLFVIETDIYPMWKQVLYYCRELSYAIDISYGIFPKKVEPKGRVYNLLKNKDIAYLYNYIFSSKPEVRDATQKFSIIIKDKEHTLVYRYVYFYDYHQEFLYELENKIF